MTATGRRLFLVLTALALALWLNHVANFAATQIQHLDVLTGAPPTPGVTWLLVGSDQRGTGGIDDGSQGARSDVMMLLQQPESGPTALISLPRDTFVQIPGWGGSRLNMAYEWGGAPLLVRTVEEFTGLTIDRFVETDFGGIYAVVDALDGVELCLDFDVDDENSFLVWESGCHLVDGPTAIAFARMRYSDPLDDVGRMARQRQLLAAIVRRAAQPAVLADPRQHLALVGAGLGAIRVDENFTVGDFAALALAFQAASGSQGVTGLPPMTLEPRDVGIGPIKEFDADQIDQFWQDFRDGNLQPTH